MSAITTTEGPAVWHVHTAHAVAGDFWDYLVVVLCHLWLVWFGLIWYNPFLIFCKLCFKQVLSMNFFRSVTCALNSPQFKMQQTAIIALVVKEKEILVEARQMFFTYFVQVVFLTADIPFGK